MFKVKKIISIIVLVCMISVFCFSFSVSALQSGEVTVLGTTGTLWNLNGNGSYYDATVVNESDIIQFRYNLGGVSGSPVAVYNNFTFSGYNYGTLKITYWHYSDNGYGRVVFDSFNGLYNENSEKIGSFNVYNDYEYVLEYTGYVPSNFSIRAYWQVSADINQSNFINFSFTPSYDNVSNDINKNQDENTDKIINNQNQLQENEKNEAESSGQGSVDDISGAIEDKSAGFISSITSLVSSMSYEGTACAWSFPALKLPAIDGVMPEYQLTEEQPIDFEFWVNKIPADILLLVRSLLTIALIGYCFKELYSTISYVLTLKGGGNNE